MLFYRAEIKVVTVALHFLNRCIKKKTYFSTLTQSKTIAMWKIDHIFKADSTWFQLQSGIDTQISGWMCCHIKQTEREREMCDVISYTDWNNQQCAHPVSPSCSDHRPNPLGGLSRLKSRKSCNFKGYRQSEKERNGVGGGKAVLRCYFFSPLWVRFVSALCFDMCFVQRQVHLHLITANLWKIQVADECYEL